MKVLLLMFWMQTPASNGTFLYEACVKTDGLLAYCLGYLSAAAEIYNYEGRICLPDGATTGQAQLIYQKWARENPEKLHEDTFLTALYALEEAFPCD